MPLTTDRSGLLQFVLTILPFTGRCSDQLVGQSKGITRQYNMKPSTYITALILVFQASTLFAGSLSTSKTSHNFGQALSGELITHTFTLSNTTEDPIQITDIRTSCGCTASKLEKRLLEPGDSVDLEVQFSLRGRRGPQRTSVVVFTDSEDNPRLTLSLVGHAIEPVQVQPSELVFGQVRPGQQAERRLSITSHDHQNPLNVHEIKLIQAGRQKSDEDAHIDWKTSLQTLQAGQAYELTVAFDANGSLGRHDAQVELHTDSSLYPILRIPVSAVITGDLSLTPDVIMIDPMEPVATRHMMVALRRDGQPVPFKLTRVQSLLEQEMQINHRPMGQGAYQIRVANLQVADLPEGQALVIETDLAEYPRVVVPLVLQPTQKSEEHAGHVMGYC